MPIALQKLNRIQIRVNFSQLHHMDYLEFTIKDEEIVNTLPQLLSHHETLCSEWTPDSDQPGCPILPLSDLCYI